MARFIAALVLLAVLVGVVAYWQGWVRVAEVEPPAGGDDKVDVKVTVDKEKFREDVQGFQREARELKESAGEALQIKSAEGRIAAIDSAARTIDLRRADDTLLQVHIDDRTEFVVRSDEAANLTAFQPGEQVIVTYRATDAGPQAVKVTRVPPNIATPAPVSPPTAN